MSIYMFAQYQLSYISYKYLIIQLHHFFLLNSKDKMIDVINK